MMPPKDKLCRFSGFVEACLSLVASGKCTDAWVNIQGHHPQSGAPMDQWGCCHDFTYLLAMEAARKAHHANEATLTLRNMIFDGADVRQQELAKSTELKTIEAAE